MTCRFHVAGNVHNGRAIVEGEPCPLCGAPVEARMTSMGIVTPLPDLAEQADALGIDGRDFVTVNGKLVLNRIAKYAEENGIDEAVVMAAAQRHCVPCRRR